MNKIVTFDKDVATEILDIFNMRVDSHGYICYKNKKKRCVAIDGKWIKIEDFAGICKKGLIRNNICDIISLMEEK